MRVTITVAGTRGDVQPCVALGRGLEDAGHKVTVAAHATFEGLAREAGLRFHPVAGPDPKLLMEALLEAGRNPFRYAETFRPLLEPTLVRSYEDYREACRDAGAVVYTPVGFLGYMVAEELGLARVGAAVEPIFSRNRLFPSCVLGQPPGGGRLAETPGVGGLYNYLSYLVTEQVYWRVMMPGASRVRRNAGLHPMPFLGPFGKMNRDREPILHGWSPAVLPEPSGWRDRTPATGYWFLEPGDGWRPPEKLVAFLEAGPPPVAVGFGSLGGPGTEQLLQTVVEALGRARRRGVLVTKWDGIRSSDLPDEVLKVDEAPYGWLFARCGASVNHGGAGTVAAALRAGIPSVVIPALPDQEFWGWRVAALGAGPEQLSPTKLSAGRLAAAIRETADPAMRRRVAGLGRKIRTEDGVGRAVREFQRQVSRQVGGC